MPWMVPAVVIMAVIIVALFNAIPPALIIGLAIPFAFIESTANWYWLYDLLTEHGMKVVISNPVKTKAIASEDIELA